MLDCRTERSSGSTELVPHGRGRARVGVAKGQEAATEARIPTGSYVEVIDDWLRDDLDAPRKQRHTAKRIFDRLLDEHDAVGVVSYWMVREYVATRRREIRIRGRARTRERLHTSGALARSGGRGLFR